MKREKRTEKKTEEEPPFLEFVKSTNENVNDFLKKYCC